MTDDSELTSYDSINIENYLAIVERPESWNNLYERPYVLSCFSSFQDKNVLDVGCSSGYYAEYALKNGATVTGIDISERMLKRLGSRKLPGLKLIKADVTKPMPFLESKSFDYIVCSLVLHYIKDWTPVLAELYRVIKKGGRLVISTHHPFNMYLYVKPQSYFEFKLIEDTWAAETDHPFNVHYYIRPLENLLRPILNSPFKIVSIDEPLPNERCRQMAPDLYKRLCEKPGFLFIILERE